MFKSLRRSARMGLVMVAAIFAQHAEAHFAWLLPQVDGKVIYFFGESSADRTYHLPESGKLKERAYESEMHYLTASFVVDSSAASDDQSVSLAPLPFAITSFGAARSGDAIYVYGGHTGSAHSYSTEGQSNQLLRLSLKNSGAQWEEIATGPRLQGLGMVAHGDKLILVGGFSALNAPGEDHDLHSNAEIHVYDLKAKSWSKLPALPEGRSSHDVALLGDTLYVVGGWDMNGDDDTTWHDSALSMDLSAAEPNWVELPEPEFQRRALAAVAHQGKIYVLGGMGAQGGPTKAVSVFDPQTKQWSDGPELLGENAMSGFGAAGWSHDERLYVTTYSGDLQRLSEDGKSWEMLGKTEDARFFHRLLPYGPGKLVSVGGANMDSGKFLDPEVISVAR